MIKSQALVLVGEEATKAVIEALYNPNLTLILTSSLIDVWLPGFLVDHKCPRLGAAIYNPFPYVSPTRDKTTLECHCLVNGSEGMGLSL